MSTRAEVEIDVSVAADLLDDVVPVCDLYGDGGAECSLPPVAVWHARNRPCGCSWLLCIDHGEGGQSHVEWLRAKIAEGIANGKTRRLRCHRCRVLVSPRLTEWTHL